MAADAGEAALLSDLAALKLEQVRVAGGSCVHRAAAAAAVTATATTLQMQTKHEWRAALACTLAQGDAQGAEELFRKALQAQQPADGTAEAAEEEEDSWEGGWATLVSSSRVVPIMPLLLPLLMKPSASPPRPPRMLATAIQGMGMGPVPGMQQLLLLLNPPTATYLQPGMKTAHQCPRQSHQHSPQLTTATAGRQRKRWQQHSDAAAKSPLQQRQPPAAAAMGRKRRCSLGEATYWNCLTSRPHCEPSTWRPFWSASAAATLCSQPSSAPAACRPRCPGLIGPGCRRRC